MGAGLKDIVVVSGKVYKPVRFDQKVLLIDLMNGKAVSNEPMWVEDGSDTDNPIFNIKAYLHTEDFSVHSNYDIVYSRESRSRWNESRHLKN